MISMLDISKRDPRLILVELKDGRTIRCSFHAILPKDVDDGQMYDAMEVYLGRDKGYIDVIWDDIKNIQIIK